MSERAFFLGAPVEPATGVRSEGRYELDPDDLTTHAVIVGMTGSGKTGLGVTMVEEARLAGVPCLVIDPKGDMGNLALTFPGLSAGDFRPWLDPTAGDGGDGTDAADTVASSWREGLAGWGLGAEDIARLSDSTDLSIYTPGSTAGIPLDIVGSLRVPGIGWSGNEEILRDEIGDFVSSLLTLAGVDANPIADPEHVLLANLVEHRWSTGADLTLEQLIEWVIDPPLRKLGVFDVDDFYPRKQRTALAMRLNGLVASPSFRAWMEGAPVDIDEMLGFGRRPRTAVVYLAHLSDVERQFVVTMLLSKLVTWMRSQPGSSSLRALVYMDEMYGFAPPTAEPPAKKPLLTLLKQARAFGVGLVLSTQNPVDLDYKAMSNAGTWMIGRLQTERDKARILEGMDAAGGAVDIASFDRLVSGLAKRTFVTHATGSPEPAVFTTRWAMSYLAGPLTRDQISRLTPVHERATAPPAAARTESVGDAMVSVPPSADGIGVVWAAPSTPWIKTAGGTSGSALHAPAAVATVRLRYDDRYAGVDHRETWEAIIHPLDEKAASMVAVDHDDRDFRTEAPGPAEYVTREVPIESAAFWRSLSSSVADHLAAERSISVFKNPALQLYSRVGETREAFETRCEEQAAGRADAEIATLRGRYDTRVRTAGRSLRTAERRVEDLTSDVETSRQQEVLSGAGDLLGAVFGGRRSSAGLRRAASRRARTRKTEDRLEQATERLDREQADLEELEADLATDIDDIVAAWDTASGAIETVEIPLERSDVEVDPLRLLWLPVGSK